MEEQIVDQNIQGSNLQPLPQLPNATATLVLGILSIVFGCCYGVIGLPMAIIALAISGKSWKMMKEEPGVYDGEGNLKAGRTCAIIGLCISSVFIIGWIIYVIVMGSMLSMTDIWNEF